MINSCKIVREIGSGGYGKVFIAEGEDKKLYALKEISSESGAVKREFVALQFYMQKLSKRRHPSIVEILDAKIKDGKIQYLMPLADPADPSAPASSPNYEPLTLAKLIQMRKDSGREWFSYREISEIFAPIANAAVHIGQCGLLHRDIKPENILFINGKPVLSDIGLIAKDEMSITDIGTPIYKAPSWYLCTNGNPDMWGLAMTLYALATGNPPDTIGRPSYAKPLSNPISKSEKDNYRIYHKIINRALSENPNERFLRLGDFLKSFLRLEDFRESRGFQNKLKYAAAFLLGICITLAVFLYPQLKKSYNSVLQETRSPMEIIEEEAKNSKSYPQPYEKFNAFPAPTGRYYYSDLPAEIDQIDFSEIAKTYPAESVLTLLYSKMYEGARENDNKKVAMCVQAMDAAAKAYSIRLKDSETFQLQPRESQPEIFADLEKFIKPRAGAKEGRLLNHMDILQLNEFFYAKALFNLGMPNAAIKEINDYLEHANSCNYKYKVEASILFISIKKRMAEYIGEKSQRDFF
ncbi:MAG: protein kinase [Opitutales bacterium]|nr:protein kinase [Opitutales bacterium]